MVCRYFLAADGGAAAISPFFRVSGEGRSAAGDLQCCAAVGQAQCGIEVATVWYRGSRGRDMVAEAETGWERQCGRGRNSVARHD